MQGRANEIMERYYPTLQKPLVVISPRMTWAAGRAFPAIREVRIARGYIEECGWQEADVTLRHELIHIALWQIDCTVKVHGPEFYGECTRLGIPPERTCRPWGEHRKKRFYIYECPLCGTQRILYKRFESILCCSQRVRATWVGRSNGDMGAPAVAKTLVRL